MHSRFQTTSTTLATNLQVTIAPMLADPRFPALLETGQVATLQQAIGLDEDALAFTPLPLAVTCARTDPSHFNVGTIVRGVSGCQYFGGNTEFPSATTQQTVHTEQSAISRAWLRGETSLHAITVNYTPCGHCRQFMNELNSGLALHVHLPGREAYALEHYLPDAFSPRDLEIKILLIDTQDYGLPVSGDALIQVATQTANCCHTLYSHSPFDVTLELKDGTIFSGSYTENTVFNPMLPPLQGALNLLSLNGYDYPVIQRATLAEKVDAALIQQDATTTTLKALDCQSIERVLLS